MSVSKITEWFNKEIWWLSFAAITWTVFIQFLGISLLLPLFDFRFWPLWTLLGVPSSWLYDFLLIFGIVCVGWDYESNFRVVPYVRKGTFDLLLGMAAQSGSFVLHVLSSGLLVRCYVGFLNGGGHSSSESLTRPCHGATCLNDAHIFIVLSGCWNGICHWYSYHFGNGNLVQFPLVNLRKKAQIRLRLPALVRESMIKASLNIRWFILFYVIYGGNLHNFFCKLLRLNAEVINIHQFGDSWTLFFWNLMVVSGHSWILNSLLETVLNTLHLFLSVYLTQPQHFDVDLLSSSSLSTTDNSRSLVDAMNEKCPPLLRHLAYQDFCNLSADSPTARSHFFLLSQPGGHPHNWDKVSALCLGAIESFTSELIKASAPKSSSESKSKHQENQIQANNNSAENNPNLRLRHLAVIPPPLKSPSGIQDLKQASSSSPSPLPVSTMSSQIWNKVSKNPIFFSHPDSEIRSVFANHSQIVIWAVEGLSHVVASSVKEDRFGVIQRQLSHILTSLLNLQQTIERHRGMTVTTRKNKGSSDMREFQLKRELRATVKSSLYRISVAYGDHLLNIQGLSPEMQQKIKNYHFFMEG